jgi:hypothetical protein
MNKYCLDTGVLINGWQKNYMPAIAPRFWKYLSDGLELGQIIIPREVYEEVERQNDELFRWVKDRIHLITETSEEVVLALKKIMQHDHYCQIVRLKGTGRSGADPWVIAHAQASNAAVVAEEGRGGNVPRIPDVCRGLGIKCLTTGQMLIAERWSLSQ